MIKFIGFKKILIIAILFGASIFLGFMNYMVLTPQNEKVGQELDSTNSQNTVLRDEIQTMKTNLAVFETRIKLFEEIKAKGFINDQDRTAARQSFNNLQQSSKILSIQYEIKAAQVISDDLTQKANKQKISSPIDVNMTAIDDIDLYRFIALLPRSFPGHIGIREMEITRSADVTPENLKQIGLGQAPPILRANMQLSWTTLVDQPSENSESNPAQGEGAPQ